MTNSGKFHRFLYAVYSIGLMLIDWTRGSQVGSTWAWTVNMSGLIVCLFMITADEIRNFVKAKYALWSGIMVAIIISSYFWWQQNQGVIYRDKLLTAVCNIWLIGICFIRLIDIKQGKNWLCAIWKNALLLFAGSMFLLMFISRNEDIWPLWFLMLLILVYSWPIDIFEKKMMIDGVVDGIIVSFFLLQGAAFIFRPFDDPDFRYAGIYSNTNMNALFYCVVLIAFLFRLYQLRSEQGSVWKRLVCFLFSAALIGFSVLTVCKTAWVVEFICLLLYVVLIDIRELNYKANWVVTRILLFGLVACFSVPIAYLPVRYLPPVFHHPIWYEGEYSEAKVHSWDSMDSEKYVSFEEVMGAVSGRLRPVIERLFANEEFPNVVYAEELMDPTGIHIGPYYYSWDDEFTQTYSSYLGRVATWYYYFRNGRLFGHSNLDGHHTGMGASYTWHAQNVFFQIWYYYGIVAGVLFLIVSVGTLWVSITRVWNDASKSKEGAIFAFLYLTLFLLFGLFEAVWYPGQMILTLAVFGPKLMMKDKDIHEEISNSSV